MIYKFNTIELDTENYRLLADGVEQSVEPQVFNLVVYLIQNKDKVISREEILEHIWKDRIVSDSSISNHIKSARKVLGDDGYKQQVIKTVHSRGYQFIAACESVDESISVSESIDKSHSVSIRYLIPLAIFLIFTIGIWFISDKSKIKNSDQKIDNSIAVLAFKDLSPNSDQNYFAEGISEELLNIFTRIPDLKVASRTSSFSFKNKDVRLESIGKELNVKYIMEGSVRKSGDKIRVTAQLIRVNDGSHVWSETYDHDIQDVFKIQDEIAQAVSEQLKLSLAKSIQKDSAVNPKAESLYLKALYYLRENTGNSLKQALELTEEAINLDSNVAKTWTLKSQIHYRLALYSYAKDGNINLDLAKLAISKAKSLDNKHATTYAQMALLDLSHFDFGSARFNSELALSLEDKSTITSGLIAQYYQLTRQLTKSNKVLEEISIFDPINDTFYLNLALNQWSSNELENAYSTIRKYGYFHANAVGHHAIKSQILMALGDLEPAKIEAEKETNDFWKLMALSHVNFDLEDKQHADEILQKILTDYSNTPSYIATLYAYRKDIDNAFKWLDIAYNEKDMNLLYAINHHSLRILWKDKRWQEFIDKIGLTNSH